MIMMHMVEQDLNKSENIDEKVDLKQAFSDVEKNDDVDL